MLPPRVRERRPDLRPFGQPERQRVGLFLLQRLNADTGTKPIGARYHSVNCKSQEDAVHQVVYLVGLVVVVIAVLSFFGLR